MFWCIYQAVYISLPLFYIPLISLDFSWFQSIHFSLGHAKTPFGAAFHAPRRGDAQALQRGGDRIARHDGHPERHKAKPKKNMKKKQYILHIYIYYISSCLCLLKSQTAKQNAFRFQTLKSDWSHLALTPCGRAPWSPAFKVLSLPELRCRSASSSK